MASLNLSEKVYLNLSAELSVFGKEISDLSCYENKKLQKVLNSNVPVVINSEQPYSYAKKVANHVAPNSSVVISNNGAYARGLDGTVYMDKKIPRTAIEAIEKVLKDKGFFGYGLPVIQTLDEKFSCVDTNFSLWKRIKIHLGFGKKLELNNGLYENAKDNAYNFNFQLFPLPSKNTKQYAKSKKNPKGLAWNQMYNLTLKHQQKVTYGAMQALFNADEETRKLYEPYVNITISQDGFSLMPKGCSKVDTLTKYCSENNINMSSVMLYGNQFSDFFKSVNFADIRKEKVEADFVGEDFNISKSFMKLSKLPENMTPNNNMQTYYIGTIHKFSQNQLEKKLKQVEDDVLAKDLEVFRDGLLKKRTEVERVNKYSRKIQELIERVPQTLENGEPNPKFEEDKKAIQLEINNIMEKATKEINNTPLAKEDIFDIKTIDAMKSDLQEKLEKLSSLQAEKKDNNEVGTEPNDTGDKNQESEPKNVAKAVPFSDPLTF